MSDLTPALISLDKGLNLQSAKIVAVPGSLLNTLNYEQVDFQGQKRIDGYTQYDGSFLATIDNWYEITVDSDVAITAGDLISTVQGLLGVAVDTSDTPVISLAIINPNLIPVVGDLVYVTLNGIDSAQTVVDIESGLSTAESPQDHQARVIQYNGVLRGLVEVLPGTVIGLHWFRDRLYAVANVSAFSMPDATPTIYPNDVLTVETTDGNIDTKVLDSFVVHDDVDDVDVRIVLVNTLDSDIEEIGDVHRGVTLVGQVGLFGSDFNTRYSLYNTASFFESRSQQQVLDEDGPSGPYDFGWRFVDQGWVVKFADGISLFGSLPSLNQNITGLGTEGPTSIVDPNGSPLALSQKLPITNKIMQVNGWKSTSTPTTYVLNPSDVADIDSTYTYADAFISWDGTSGAVSAPGINGDTLTEYPANNTIVVEV